MRTFLLLIFSLALLTTQAQPGPGNRRERVQALRVAYFTEQLNLTANEAKTFWPVFDAYAEEMDIIRKQNRMLRFEARTGFSGMSEQELEAVADEYISLKKREYEITAKYHPQFKEVLPPGKLVLFYKAEQEFPKWVLSHLREMRD